VSLLYLEKCEFTKIAPTESTAMADEACAYGRECDHGRRAGNKPVRPATNSKHIELQNLDLFFTAVLVCSV